MVPEEEFNALSADFQAILRKHSANGALVFCRLPQGVLGRLVSPALFQALIHFEADAAADSTHYRQLQAITEHYPGDECCQFLEPTRTSAFTQEGLQWWLDHTLAFVHAVVVTLNQKDTLHQLFAAKETNPAFAYILECAYHDIDQETLDALKDNALIEKLRLFVQTHIDCLEEEIPANQRYSRKFFIVVHMAPLLKALGCADESVPIKIDRSERKRPIVNQAQQLERLGVVLDVLDTDKNKTLWGSARPNVCEAITSKMATSTTQLEALRTTVKEALEASQQPSVTTQSTLARIGVTLFGRTCCGTATRVVTAAGATLLIGHLLKLAFAAQILALPPASLVMIAIYCCLATLITHVIVDRTCGDLPPPITPGCCS